MYNQFDDKLSSRIRDVFEDFEDDSADLGWQELRKRFPGEKEKKTVVLWWWQSAAAILLLALGTWAYFSFETDKVYLAGKSSKQAKPQTQQHASENTLANTQNSYEPLSGVENNSENIHRGISTDNTINTDKPDYPGKSKRTTSYHGKREEQNGNHGQIKNILAVLEEEDRVTPAVFTDVTDEPVSTKSTPVVVHQNAGNTFENAVISDFLQSKPASAQKTIPLALIAENPKKEQPKVKDKKLSIGIFAGSFFNYASGSSSSINTGVGLSSEIGLSKKLKLATGVSLAQNTLQFENNEIPQNVEASFISSINANLQSDIKGSLLPPGVSPSNTSYNINKYDASLLGLDIPVNLKYTFIENRNELYVIAGVSSNLFIEESYSYSYLANSDKSVSASTSDDTEGSAKFKNFDFARTLNVSMGFGRAVGKNRLSFEPFLKYPLGGQGARDLRFGAAGMNLKLNFSGLKNKH